MDDHQQSRWSVLGAATGLGVASLVLPAATAAASNVTPLVSTTTAFTAAGVFSVPDGITSVIVTAEGTAGGVAPATAEGVTLKNGTAGRGGRVVATVAVTPGSDLQVVVGASVAGQPDPVTSLAPYPGGAGGAAVGVRSGSTWLVVAGGGGGAGGGLAQQGTPVVYSSTVYVGGNGGDATGADSPASATSGTSSAGTAAAGSSASGGTVGVGGFSPIGGPNTTDDGKNGTAFSATDLGAGGQAGVITNPGGGGGAGDAGGGGGGAHNSNGGGAGGGGGSNYVDGSATSVVQGYSSRSLGDGVLLTIQTVVD